MMLRRETHEADATGGAILPAIGARAHGSGPPLLKRVRRSTAFLGVALLVLVALGMVSFLHAAVQLKAAQASPLVGRLTEPSPSRPIAGATLTITANDSLATDYACVGWVQTGVCSPDGPREPHNDAICSTAIQGGRSGYCLFRHTRTDAMRRVLPMHCDSLFHGASFRCDEAAALLAYGERAPAYVHDAGFSLDANQAAVRASLSSPPPLTRGIAIVVHDAVLGSAFASVRHLRELGSTLPIEMWYRANEVQPTHPILQELVAKHGVFLRELTDPRATKYYTKLFAVFYSAFDSVLLLDADNFAVKEPSYLFETVEFQATGALFWPDYWQPSTTIFNIHARSLVWPVLGLEFVDTFEQESGQVLIDRRRHRKALDAAMYYATAQPRYIEQLQLAFGDKDLFRFAWMKTQSRFLFVPKLPGAVGMLHVQKNQFCGLSMIQYDLQGDVVFLHRNTAKLRLTGERRHVWTHVLTIKPTSPRKEYAMGWARVFDNIPSCWGRFTDFTHYDVVPADEMLYKAMETRLFQYVDEAAALVDTVKR